MRLLRPALPAWVLLAAGIAAAQQPPGIIGFAPGAGMPPAAPIPKRSLTAAEAQALIGQSVRTRDGQSAGEIRDFVLGGPDGRIERIVLASGGFLGVGARVYSVPAGALRVEAAPKVPIFGEGRPMDVTLDMDAAELEDAPQFAYSPDTLSLVRRK